MERNHDNSLQKNLKMIKGGGELLASFILYYVQIGSANLLDIKPCSCNYVLRLWNRYTKFATILPAFDSVDELHILIYDPQFQVKINDVKDQNTFFF